MTFDTGMLFAFWCSEGKTRREAQRLVEEMEYFMNSKPIDPQLILASPNAAPRPCDAKELHRTTLALRPYIVSNLDNAKLALTWANNLSGNTACGAACDILNCHPALRETGECTAFIRDHRDEILAWRGA